MSIIRVSKRSRYAIISNDLLEDIRLTWAARGLAAFLLSKPDDWEINVSHLIKQSPTGRDGVYSILRELERIGYLRRNLKRQGGKFAGTGWTIHEFPMVEIEGGKSPHTGFPDTVAPHTGFPDTAKPDTAKPDPENPTLLINEFTNYGEELKTDNSSRKKRKKASSKTGGISVPGPAAAENKELNELAWPTAIGAPQRKAITAKVSGLNIDQAQEVLDVLAVRIADKPTLNPVTYTNGLLRRLQAGDFDPSDGWPVREARERQKRIRAAEQRADDQARTSAPGMSCTEGRAAMLAAVGLRR